jgi:hypothetical protein
MQIAGEGHRGSAGRVCEFAFPLHICRYMRRRQGARSPNSGKQRAAHGARGCTPEAPSGAAQAVCPPAAASVALPACRCDRGHPETTVYKDAARG